jgi:hypothetical protein
MNDISIQFALIDRLATGDLDDGARRELFTWLDGEPQRWRRCALALLEAREIEQALGAWRSETPRPIVKSLAPPPSRSRRGAVLALAASVLIAFGLGIFARGFWASDVRLVADVPPAPNAGHPLSPPGGAVSSPSDTTPSDVRRTPSSPRRSVAAVEPAPPRQPADSIPSYIRGQWERRGFQLTSRPAQLPVILPDGRRMMASVDEWQLNYVGQRTY